MNILVCIKQVPDTTEIKINPETNTLIRQGVPSIVNPFDTYALEMAARLKDAAGGEITVITMGPEQAANALRECLAAGADKAYLVNDAAFAGSDTLATSKILAKACEKTGPFDIIFCGKQAIDGDTGQVGPELAEYLDMAQITNISELELSGAGIKGKKEFGDGYEVVEARLPAVVTVTKTLYEPRYPTIKSKMAARRAQIDKITFADLELEADSIGLKGSPTRVKKTFVPQAKGNGVIIQNEPADTAARKLVALLGENKLV